MVGQKIANLSGAGSNPVLGSNLNLPPKKGYNERL